MKKYFILLLLSAFLRMNGQKTEVQYLSGTDKDNTVQWDFFCTHGMNSGSWSRIGVPSCWELQGFGSYLYGNVNRNADEKGMYRFEFSVPAEWEKKQVNIVFEGSMTDTEVKINGKVAGPVHQGAFYRFRYDISGLLNFEGSNLLEVNVSKESSNESVNRAERISDFWVFGGIFRPVYLEALPVQHIDRVAVDARADGSFYMDVYVKGKGKAKQVTARVETIDGKPFGQVMITTVKKDTTGRSIIKGTFENPALWNPEFPNRYQVVVSLISGKNVVHSVTQKFGFRTVEVRPQDGIYVNGRKIIFKGVCRHTFWPSSGRTSSRQLAIEDINLMKDMNMNAVRMSHYPTDQYFLDVCDSLGMFVLDELAGWQKFYDTPTAKRLVRSMIERDVNHPSIVLWDNGNEGGFNPDARGDYALYDPQKRTVIEPWSIINGTNTKHYPKFDYVKEALDKGKEIFFPTEFLHGLNDGGHGAGLDDQWNFMLSKPLSAGAFLWVFADEGVERRDFNDSIDAEGNRGPDGILGPYHEKEGSFYTVKEIWAPVYFNDKNIDRSFTGNLNITNRYLYTNLSACRFSYELVRFIFPEGISGNVSGEIVSPDLEPGKDGVLKVPLPSDWSNYDALYVSARDQYGRHINTWSWKISSPAEIAARIVIPVEEKARTAVKNNMFSVRSGRTELTFNMNTAALTGVKNGGIPISFSCGYPFAGLKRTIRTFRPHETPGGYMIEILYDSASYTNWTVLGDGWIKLDYGFNLAGSYDFAGVTFSYPENLVTGARLLADGPYRVWKNRLKGTEFGLHDKKSNNTVTGQSWDYPEFRGYYSGLYAVQIRTLEQPITIVSATEDL
ncbi:MAG: glycoside hydrolase family 2 TIM barrel-domain containing protein, partial [Chloroflexota bacterium]